MSLLGKILLFVNLLAAGALIFVANQDWAKRQEITANALMHSLVLTGMPFATADQGDSESFVDFPVELTGARVTTGVRRNLVRNYLKGASGGERLGVITGADAAPVTSQLGEIARIEEKLGAVVAAADPVGKLELLCGRYDGTRFAPGLLVRLAESFEERELVRQAARLPEPMSAEAVNERVRKAEAILKRKFDVVKAEPNPQLAASHAEEVRQAAEKLRGLLLPRQNAHAKLMRAEAARDVPAIAAAQAEVTEADTAVKQAMREFADVLAGGQTPPAARDQHDRRRRAAHLLILLDKSGEWQNRVARVVGLRAYHAAVLDQTNRLLDITRSVQRQIESDQASFVDLYEQLKNIAIDRAELAIKQEAIARVLAEQAARDAESNRRRAAELEERRQVLADVKADVAAKLDALSDLEARLFEVQKQVGETLWLNFELEERLDRAEEQAVKQGRTTTRAR